MDILGMLGSLARQAPRAVASYREGQREGEQEQFDVMQTLKAQAERAALLKQQQERQARLDEQQSRLVASQIAENDAQAQERLRPKAEAPRAPVMGSPEWLAAREAEMRLQAKYRAPRGGSGGGDESSSGPKVGPGTWTVQEGPDGLVQVNNKTGETRFVQSPDGTGPLRKKAPQAVIAAVGENRKNLNTIDEALRGVSSHPTAVGTRRMLTPDFISQRTDAAGTGARAAIADIGSMVLHTRSGAAVTISEWPRLSPFIPKVSDDSDVVQAKLKRLRQAIAEETQFLSDAHGMRDAVPVAERKQPSPQQIERAMNDPVYAAFLKSQGY